MKKKAEDYVLQFRIMPEEELQRVLQKAQKGGKFYPLEVGTLVQQILYWREAFQQQKELSEFLQNKLDVLENLVRTPKRTSRIGSSSFASRRVQNQYQRSQQI